MVTALTREAVQRRAKNRCEYCLLHQEDSALAHHIEHIIAKQHGGSDDQNNLALACHRCNLHKGSNLTGIDPVSLKVVSLFHPRHESWSEHFVFNDVSVIGLTPGGRASVQVLAMNDTRRLELRAELLKQSKYKKGLAGDA
jgi:HNH endonuclease